MKLGIFFFGLLICFGSLGQVTYSGYIYNGEEEILPFSTNVVKSLKDSLILAYAISDSYGHYELNFTSNEDSVIFIVSHLGYTSYEKVIAVRSQQIDVTLLQSTVELNELIIRPDNGIRLSSDTLKYDVEHFTAKGDLVIADFIKRLPGINIQSNGTILYMGRPIDKYYIEGLDLLEGRYNLANNNLPIGAVEEVQILENHQSVRVLDSLFRSNETSLNIKLKNRVTLTGEASFALGMPLPQYQINATPMMFVPNRQLLMSYQGNNTGDNIPNQLEVLSIEDVLSLRDGYVVDRAWLGIQEIRPSDMPEYRWLFNQTHLATPNFLRKYVNDLQVKFNLRYLSDIQNQYGSVHTRFFTSTDTINITEITDNRLLSQKYGGTLVFEKNNSTFFLKNKLEVDHKSQTNSGNLLGTNEISQQFTLPQTSVMNRFNAVFPFRSKLVSLQSIISYNQSNNLLAVSPGVFSDLLNDGVQYDTSKQSLLTKNIFTNQSFGLTQKWKSFTFDVKTGVQYKSSIVQSELMVDEETDQDIQNNLQMDNYAVYSEVTTQLQIGQWAASSGVKSSYLRYWFLLNQNDPNINDDLFFIEPKIHVVRHISSNFQASVSLGLSNKIGTIDQLYTGYILSSYRDLKRNSAILPRSLSKNASILLGYKNLIRGYFININYSHYQTNFNTIQGFSINDFGGRTLNRIEKNNVGKNHILKTNASKYFDLIKLTISLQNEFSYTFANQLIEGSPVEIKSFNSQWMPDVSWRIIDKIVLSYAFKMHSLSNSINENLVNQFESFSHLTRLVYSPKNHLCSFNFENYRQNFSTLQTSSFLDFEYSYKSKKNEIIISVNNFFNNQNFVSLYSDQNLFTIRDYQLRPRQILLGTKYSF